MVCAANQLNSHLIPGGSPRPSARCRRCQLAPPHAARVRPAALPAWLAPPCARGRSPSRTRWLREPRTCRRTPIRPARVRSVQVLGSACIRGVNGNMLWRGRKASNSVAHSAAAASRGVTIARVTDVQSDAMKCGCTEQTVQTMLGKRLGLGAAHHLARRWRISSVWAAPLP